MQKCLSIRNTSRVWSRPQVIRSSDLKYPFMGFVRIVKRSAKHLFLENALRALVFVGTVRPDPGSIGRVADHAKWS